MIPIADLKLLAVTRLAEAEILLQSGHFDGGAYLCGYSVEFALKARICLTLKWEEFPSTRGEFQDYQSFRTHNLEVLLHLSGIEEEVKKDHFDHWYRISEWNPDIRYLSGFQRESVEKMIISARALLRILI
jgi:hypothetical protein